MYVQKKHVIIAAIVILFLIACAALTVALVRQNSEAMGSAGTGGGTNLVLNLDTNAEDLAAPTEPPPPPPGIKIPGYARMEIPAGATDVSVNLVNPEGNPCYFTFEIVLADTDESIYQSDLVEPNKSIQQATMSRSLDAGEYPAIIKIRTFALDGMGELNGADMNTLLVAK